MYLTHYLIRTRRAFTLCKGTARGFLALQCCAGTDSMLCVGVDKVESYVQLLPIPTFVIAAALLHMWMPDYMNEHDLDKNRGWTGLNCRWQVSVKFLSLQCYGLWTLVSQGWTCMVITAIIIIGSCSEEVNQVMQQHCTGSLSWSLGPTSHGTWYDWNSIFYNIPFPSPPVFVSVCA